MNPERISAIRSEKLKVMVSAVQLAGDFMLTSGGLNQSKDKSNVKDFVTIADIKSQDILRDELSRAFPDSMIISEEDDEIARNAIYAPTFSGFILDPIDGTYNFKRDMRESAISIGYIENGEPIHGVILDPYKDEMYEAEKGLGSFRNGMPITVSSQSDLRGANVGTSNGYDDEAAVRNFKRQIGIFAQTGVMPWANLSGSGIISMAMVACGRADAFHHNGLKPWDNAAAFLLVREAGGIVEDLNGAPAKFTDATILMGNPSIQTQLRNVFSKLPAELLV